jgi:hypothetical protein
MERTLAAIAGKTGTGKSLWTKLATRAYRRLLVYDPSQTFPNVHWCSEEELENLGGDEYDNFPDNFRLGCADPSCIDLLSDIACVVGRCGFIMEECHTVFSRNMVAPDWLKRQIYYGRHLRIDSYFIAQRASALLIDIRSQVNRVISFNQSESDDCDWLRAFFDKDVIKNEIPRLPPLTCYDYQPTGTVRYSIHGQAEKYLGIRVDLLGRSRLDHMDASSVDSESNTGD